MLCVFAVSRLETIYVHEMNCTYRGMFWQSYRYSLFTLTYMVTYAYGQIGECNDLQTSCNFFFTSTYKAWKSQVKRIYLSRNDKRLATHDRACISSQEKFQRRRLARPVATVRSWNENTTIRISMLVEFIFSEFSFFSRTASEAENQTRTRGRVQFEMLFEIRSVYS